jgi:peptide/nickel transport system permease protein
MRQYTLKRIGLFFPTVVLITIIVFLIMRLIPGDPALAILAEGEASFTQQDLIELRQELGTDRPLDVQYFDWIAGPWFAGKLRCIYSFGTSCGHDQGWISVVEEIAEGDKRFLTKLTVADAQLIKSGVQLGDRFKTGFPATISGVITGNFGDSFWFNSSVMNELKERIPITAELTILAMVISMVIAIPLGVISAIRPESWIDYSARLFTMTGIAVPNFLVAILLILFLIAVFDWMPPLGYKNLWEDPGTNLSQMIFPALTLGFYQMAFIARVTRSSMMEVIREDYMRTARSKGLSEQVVLVRHGLKNAILPVLTISGWQFARLFGGAVIIESIFMIPGMGRILIDAMFQRDYVMIQAEIVIFGLAIVTINLIVDLLYGLLDPRIRYS